MSEMIERVARALALAMWQGTRPSEKAVESSEFYVDMCWKSYAPDAKAAIEAMREPTVSMMKAGENTEDPYEGGSCELSWPAMIDAALQDSPPIIRVEGETQ